jgi:hypothetical protein
MTGQFSRINGYRQLIVNLNTYPKVTEQFQCGRNVPQMWHVANNQILISQQ